MKGHVQQHVASFCVQLCHAMSMAAQHTLHACNAACCDLAQFVAVCLSLMDSHVQQFVAYLCSAMPCNADGSAAL